MPDRTAPPDAAPHTTAPAPKATIGPHDLVISAGDCEFYASCSCGAPLGGPTRPDESFNVLGERWERHVMAEHRDCDCEPCSW